MSSSPIVLSFWTCGKIWSRATRLSQLNVYRIFYCSSGQLAGLCCMTIRSWAIKPLNWVPSNSEKSWESGNSRPQSSGIWGAAGATLAAKVRAFANCGLKPPTTSPDCCASWVISANSCRSFLSVPGAAGLLLTSTHSSVRVCICYSNSVWSHCGGRNCFDCSSVICWCRLMIWCGWWHTICTSRMGCEYCATLFNTSWVCANALFNLSNLMASLCLSISAMMVSWSSRDTKATQGSVDPDMAVDQAHLQVPIVCIDFEGSWGWRYYNNQQNPKRLSCCCCCCCMSDCQLCSYTIMSLESQTSWGSQAVNRPKCCPWYFAQCCPTTWLLISRPPHSLAASVQ